MAAVIFNKLFFQPLFNILVFLTLVLPFHDLGLAVILLTIGIKFILFPFSHRAAKTQNKIKIIEPELQKIRKEVQDRQEQARLTMELYKKHGVNPFSSIVFMFIQLPVLIALYMVFQSDFAQSAGYLYSFVNLPQAINTNFFGFIELTKPSVVLAVLAGVSQFLQVKLAQPPKSAGDKKSAPDFSRALNWQMTYFMPVFIFIIALRFSAAVSLYWTTMNIFAIVHEGIVRKKAKQIYERSNQTNSRDNSSPI